MFHPFLFTTCGAQLDQDGFCTVNLGDSCQWCDGFFGLKSFLQDLAIYGGKIWVHTFKSGTALETLRRLYEKRVFFLVPHLISWLSGVFWSHCLVWSLQLLLSNIFRTFPLTEKSPAVSKQGESFPIWVFRMHHCSSIANRRFPTLTWFLLLSYWDLRCWCCSLHRQGLRRVRVS